MYKNTLQQLHYHHISFYFSPWSAICGHAAHSPFARVFERFNFSFSPHCFHCYSLPSFYNGGDKAKSALSVLLYFASVLSISRTLLH